MTSLVSIGARAVARHGQKQVRSLSSMPSFWEGGGSSSEDAPQEHKEVHHSFTLEETLENIFEMQRLGSDDVKEHKTWERVVRSSLYSESAALEETDESLFDKADSYSKRQCRVCGRKEDLCDLCSNGIIVSQFVPDNTKTSPPSR